MTTPSLMALVDARLALVALRKLDAAEQQARAPEVLAAFSVFWTSQPSQAEFAAVMNGVVLLPAILYQMVQPRVTSDVTDAQRHAAALGGPRWTG